MNVKRIALLGVLGMLALPALADASSPLTATMIRIGDHPAFVRAVVDFSGGTITTKQVDALGFTRISAPVRVSRKSIATRARPRSASGLTVRVLPGTGTLRIQSTFAPWRFKYLSYGVVLGNRLAIDLWKSAPPTKAAEIRSGVGGCLTLRSQRMTPGAVTVTGSANGIFENTFQVRVRGANGRVIGSRRLTHAGRWSTRVPYRATRRQTGTLEAVALSPKDGALTCIAQVRVTLPAS